MADWAAGGRVDSEQSERVDRACRQENLSRPSKTGTILFDLFNMIDPSADDMFTGKKGTSVGRKVFWGGQT